MRTLKPSFSWFLDVWTCPWTPKPIFFVFWNTRTRYKSQQNTKLFLIFYKYQNFWNCGMYNHGCANINEAGPGYPWIFVNFHACPRISMDNGDPWMCIEQGGGKVEVGHSRNWGPIPWKQPPIWSASSACQMGTLWERTSTAILFEHAQHEWLRQCGKLPRTKK